MVVPASAYNPLIPQSTDQPSISQGDLLNNFGAIQTLIDVDHVDFANINAGQHNKVTLPVQGVAPAFAPGTLGIYNLPFATTARNELFVTDAAGASTPITASLSGGVSGWTYLPTGMKMIWGQGTILAGNSTVTVLFSSVAGFPGFSTSALGIQLTRINTATSTNFIQLNSFTNLQFIARRSTSTTGSPDTFTWFAIGR